MNDYKEGWPGNDRKEYPCRVLHIITCTCGRKHDFSYLSAEPGDDDSDGLDLHCECGEYWKKLGRLTTPYDTFYKPLKG